MGCRQGTLKTHCSGQSYCVRPLQRAKGSSMSSLVGQVTQAEGDHTFPGQFPSLMGGVSSVERVLRRDLSLAGSENNEREGLPSHCFLRPLQVGPCSPPWTLFPPRPELWECWGDPRYSLTLAPPPWAQPMPVKWAQPSKVLRALGWALGTL